MDEIQLLRHRHDAQPGPSPEATRAARVRLTGRISRSHAARPRRPFLLIMAAAALATAAAAILVARPDPGLPRRPGAATPAVTTTPTLRPVSSAERLALGAAAKAAGAPAEPTGPWAYTKLMVRLQDGRTATQELWRRVDDSAFAVIENGELRTIKGSEFEVTYGFLLSLPTDPAALLERSYTAIDEREARLKRKITPEERDLFTFQHLAMGMRESVLPEGLRAAIYGAMAKIPGVRYSGRSADLAKRKGVTLRLGGEEIFVDPGSYAYLGYRSRAGDRLLNWDSLLLGRFVDRAGER
ncbi:CU044_5270 family protein [Nonomuraea soli]|uniref:CU044_5270 family protein n=1 Tax=Nonomuraea soli TaxID=1032476 RepID=A0A7W0CDD3_9ACTN|nr:CU044_5270 family protein [Nonomuraea soli]MBA2888947.1 hypothetical protein [Nonomuraea soli]